MKKKNGFTLIELLAVIVILAVIALIAVPRIIEILNKARISAAEDSTMGIVEATESYVASFMLQNHGAIPENLEFECNSTGCNLKTKLNGYNTENLDKLEFKGKKPTSGTIIVSNGGSNIITTNLNINNFTCLYSKGKSSCIEKKEIKENGTKVYFNPVTGKQCSENEYDKDQSKTGVTDGCMQWYIFNDNKDNAVYNLILDHNITGNLAWYASSLDNTKGPKEVLEALQEATIEWSDELISPIPYIANWTYSGSTYNYTIDYSEYGNKARLISSEEINTITEKGNNNLNSIVGGFLDTNCNVSGKCNPGENKYAWLFDNTENCTLYGGNVAQSGPWGYWTSSPIATSSNNAWEMNSDGYLNKINVNDTHRSGVRPVITISKLLIKF